MHLLLFYLTIQSTRVSIISVRFLADLNTVLNMEEDYKHSLGTKNGIEKYFHNEDPRWYNRIKTLKGLNLVESYISGIFDEVNRDLFQFGIQFDLMMDKDLTPHTQYECSIDVTLNTLLPEMKRDKNFIWNGRDEINTILLASCENVNPDIIHTPIITDQNTECHLLGIVYYRDPKKTFKDIRKLLYQMLGIHLNMTLETQYRFIIENYLSDCKMTKYEKNITTGNLKEPISVVGDILRVYG